jgi:type VI secretion system secreted protein VgrG
MTRTVIFALMAIIGSAGASAQAFADFVDLGTAGNFAVLAATTVTNTGPSVIDGGNIGLSPGTEVTGFPPGVLSPPYAFHVADAVAAQARNDLITAYAYAAGLVPALDLTGQDLGGMTLTPGVYSFDSSAQLTGTLTLDAQGDPNALFVFQMGSTLTTASNSSVVTINGGAEPGCNVYWQVGSSATLGTGTNFQGHILALTSITMNTNANILYGSVLAINGAVTLDSNQITNCVVPEASSMTLSLIGGGLLMGMRSLRKRMTGESGNTALVIVETEA